MTTSARAQIHQKRVPIAKSCPWAYVAAMEGDAAAMFADTRELAKFRQNFYTNSVLAFFSKFIKCKKNGVWGPMVVTDDRRCRYAPSKCPKCKFSLQPYDFR